MYIFSLSDFKVDDKVMLRVDQELPTGLPKYLKGQKLTVTGFTKVKVKCECEDGSAFNISPECLEFAE